MFELEASKQIKSLQCVKCNLTLCLKRRSILKVKQFDFFDSEDFQSQKISSSEKTIFSYGDHVGSSTFEAQSSTDLLKAAF